MNLDETFQHLQQLSDGWADNSSNKAFAPNFLHTLKQTLQQILPALESLGKYCISPVDGNSIDIFWREPITLLINIPEYDDDASYYLKCDGKEYENTGNLQEMILEIIQKCDIEQK